MENAMETRKIENKIIIVGGDHHNTLAVIRDLGRHKCDITVLVHGEFKSEKKIMVSHSKYAKKRTYWVHNNECEIYEWLMNHKNNREQKAILFPCSDLAAYTMDAHYEALSEFYVLPGFANHPGRVAYLMNKKNQKEFADENEIPMAKTWELIEVDGTFQIPDDMIYPCIIKPEVSAFGNKKDIRICKNKTELTSALEEFLNEHYASVIVQQFLIKKYEVCAYGCLINQYPHEAGGGNL
jgi:predicted ATP-grasp superfamily ATP-dependent carboligase